MAFSRRSRGSYLGGSTVIGPGSDWFSYGTPSPATPAISPQSPPKKKRPSRPTKKNKPPKKDPGRQERRKRHEEYLEKLRSDPNYRTRRERNRAELQDRLARLSVEHRSLLPRQPRPKAERERIKLALAGDDAEG